MKKKILVIDDSKPIFIMLKKIIEDNEDYRHKISIHQSFDGFNGIIDVVELEPDLILMDQTMPNLNGLETTLILKNSEKYKDIPIVFFSSLDNTFDNMRGLMYGASDYLAKQLQTKTLVDTINKYIKLEK